MAIVLRFVCNLEYNYFESKGAAEPAGPGGGGSGCNMFDKLGLIDQWVETGKAPERIVASKISDGKVVRTHAVWAYPAIAKYTGKGSMDDAANFVRAS
jgi:hypothetical protein